MMKIPTLYEENSNISETTTSKELCWETFVLLDYPVRVLFHFQYAILRFR